MAVAVLTLPWRAQLYATVLSTPVEMCSSGAMRGANKFRWAMYAASSRSLMVRTQLGFSSVRMWARMAVLNVSRHTCQSPCGLYQNPPMPVREVSVSLNHVGGCGLILRRCIDLVANDATK